jgi:putative DNA primase/helicase
MISVPPRPPSVDSFVDLWQRGFWPIGIYPPGVRLPGKRDPSKGKEPFGPKWGLERWTLERFLEFLRIHPTGGVGICLGPDRGPKGAWIADIEGDGPEAEESRARLLGELFTTMGWTSTRGTHDLVTLDEERLKAILPRLKGFESKDPAQPGVYHLPSLPGLELRLGGYKSNGVVKQLQSVVPPTPGTDGKPRAWNGVETVTALEALAAQVPTPKPKPATATRPTTTADPYARKALEEEVAKVANEPEQGQNRNNQLNRSAFALGQLVGAGVLDESEVCRALTAAAEHAGLGAGETAATVRSGIESGKSQPRDLSAVGTRPRHYTATPSRNGPPDRRTATATGAAEPNEAVDDPHRLARVFLESCFQHAEGRTLRYWQGEFYAWRDGAYRPLSTPEFNARLADAIKAEFDTQNLRELAAWEARGKTNDNGKLCSRPVARKVHTQLIGNASLATAGYTLLDARQAPTWLCDNPPFPAADVLAARNGLVHLPRWVEGRDAVCKPTPRYFGLHALDYDFEPDAPPPELWLKFLSELWPDDPEMARTIQEWFGYCLTPDTQQQKILLLVGPLRSGKGTIGRVLAGLVGAENVANPTLSSLGGPFGLAPLVGKPVAIISDARLSARSDVAQVVENLLSVSGEDGRTVDRKHRTTVTLKLPTRFAILTNELPKLSDTSGAMAGRMIIVRFTQSFYGREDTSLTERLLTERPQILRWAVEGWRRLHERGHFVQPASSRDLAQQMAELGSPVGAFVRERCRVEPGAHESVKALFSAWLEWCQEKGRKGSGDESTFGRNLRTVVPGLKVTQPRTEDDSGKEVRHRTYEGIELVRAF